MTITTFSSRSFARDAAAIKRATADGPVFITDHGKPALAVLRIEDYYRLTGEAQPQSLLDAMRALPRAEGPGFELPARDQALDDARIPDLDDTGKAA